MGGPGAGDRLAVINHCKGKGFILVNWAGIQIDGEPTARECVELAESCTGRHWGVLCTEWKQATCARDHNTRNKGSRYVRTTSRRFLKGICTG